MGQILAIAVGLIVLFGLLLHLILRFIWKMNAFKVLLAATASSIIILLIVVYVHQIFKLSNLELLLLIFPLAIIASFLIAWAEQKYLPIKEVSQELSPIEPAKPFLAPESPVITETAPVEEPSPVQETEAEPIPKPEPTVTVPVEDKPVLPQEKPEIQRELVQDEKEVFSQDYKGKPEEALEVLIDDAYGHLNSGSVDSAIQSFRLAIVFAEEPPVLIPLRIELGHLWYMSGEEVKAKEELKKAYDLAKQIGDDEKINEIGSLLDSFSE